MLKNVPGACLPLPPAASNFPSLNSYRIGVAWHAGCISCAVTRKCFRLSGRVTAQILN